MFKSVSFFIKTSQKGAFNLGEGMIVLLLGVLLAANIIPQAITTILSVNTTSWDSSSVAMWAIIPLVLVLGVVFLIYRTVLNKK